jgi:TPR repeat protein
LGELFFFGRGVPQNNQKAREWWTKAAIRGNQDAMDCLGGKTPEDDEEN